MNRFLLFIVTIAVMSLSACVTAPRKPTATSSTPPPVAPSPGIAGTPGNPPATGAAKFKLTRASVTWLDNPGLPVLLPGGMKGNLGNGDVAAALSALRIAAPRELTNALQSRQVASGANESITLMPIGGLVDANGATTAVIVRAIVTQRSSGAQWRGEYEVGNRKDAIAPKPSQRADLAAASYAASLIAAMTQAGLLP
jgi:hypothetical protein